MNFDEFNMYRDQALNLHASQEGPRQIGLDAIFAAVVARAPAAPAKSAGRPPAERQPPPQWFTDALDRLKGQTVTASHFLLLAGQSPITDDERRAVGRWLRDRGIMPTKRGGQQLFQL